MGKCELGVGWPWLGRGWCLGFGPRVVWGSGEGGVGMGWFVVC